MDKSEKFLSARFPPVSQRKDTSAHSAVTSAKNRHDPHNQQVTVSESMRQYHNNSPWIQHPATTPYHSKAYPREEIAQNS